ncbi:hypothetical protein FXB38_04875 [Bradyrhizobium cytisi]|uniref:Collagen-like protein n=1 Tax=Bradyrhizobium cytisi TaxID=515489 RepID=A0A5S4WZL4_9BRAD|nr:hypothetical protein FXB38_04875 [Bradyrhizobium cytisi]
MTELPTAPTPSISGTAVAGLIVGPAGPCGPCGPCGPATPCGPTSDVPAGHTPAAFGPKIKCVVVLIQKSPSTPSKIGSLGP